MDREKSFALNKKGIEFKKVCDFDSAMSYYQQAKSADPTNKSCYLNIYKIDLGFKRNTLSNIQIFKHLDLLESTNRTIEIAKSTDWESAYLYDEPIYLDNQIPNNFVFEFVQRNPIMILIAYDINTCFNYGFNILSSNQHLIDFHNIPNEYMDNYRKV
ncbi:MAG: hypothetical protein KJZ55_02895, partial [Flavobacteriales bacterium]|nr:hypothetical protein [Flavobacteriales bacterium]